MSRLIGMTVVTAILLTGCSGEKDSEIQKVPQTRAEPQTIAVAEEKISKSILCGD